MSTRSRFRSLAFLLPFLLLAPSAPSQEAGDSIETVLEIHMSDSGVRMVTEDSLIDTPVEEVEFERESSRDSRYEESKDGRFYFDEDVVIGPEEFVRDAVVVLFGDLDVHGTVRGDVVVLMGDLNLHGQANIEGDVVCLGGEVAADSTTNFHGEVVCFPISALLTGEGWKVLSGEDRDSYRFDVGHDIHVDVRRRMAPFDAFLRIIGMLFLSLILMLIFRSRIDRTVSALRFRPGRSILFGLLYALALLVLFIPILITLLLILAFLAVILSPIPPLMIMVVIAFLLTVTFVLLGVVFVPGLMPIFALSRSTFERGGLSPFLSVPLWVLIVWAVATLLKWIGGIPNALLILGEILFYLAGVGAIVASRFGKVAFERGGGRVGLAAGPVGAAPESVVEPLPGNEV